MKRLKMYIVPALICFLCFCFVMPCSAVSALSVSAKSAVLIEASTGKVLFEKTSTEKLPMASTTKIMTAIVAIENSSLSDKVSIDPSAVGVEGSSIYLHEGELLTMENLLYALLLSSANDAAAAIAIEVGGSIEGFADLMNEKADELGLKHTHFDNPHGLDSETHYTTAYDLARLSAYALENDTFRKIVSTYKTTIPLDGNGTRVLINHNKLLRSYDGLIGVKTGFTKKSGRCLVSAAERDGLRLVAVTIDAPDDWNDHKVMLDFGFSEYAHVTLVPVYSYTAPIPVIGGNEESVVYANTNEISAVLPRGVSVSDCVFSAEVPRFLYAPISSGDRIGYLVCKYDGEEIGRSELVTSYAVDAVTYKQSLLSKIIEFFRRIF